MDELSPEVPERLNGDLNTKRALDTLRVLEVNENTIKIQSNINGKRRKIANTSIDIKRTMEIIRAYLIENRSLICIQNELGINRNLLVKEFGIKLPQLCEAYKQSEQLRKLLEAYSIYTYEELYKLMQEGLVRIQENKAQNKRKISHESAASLVLKQGSVRKASESAHIAFSNLRCKLPKSKLYKEIQEDIFKRTKGDINRITIAAGYIIDGESYSEIIRKLKDEHSIETTRSSIRKDMEKRLLELCNLYKEDKYIRIQLDTCGIKTYKELEEMFQAVTKEIIYRESQNKLVAKKAAKKNKKTIEMADYIIKEYDEKGRIVTFIELGKNFEGSKSTLSVYLKGRLFILDEKRYQRVMKIWALSDSYTVKNTNSFTNNLANE